MTGYVRLDLPNRSHAEYERLGERLVRAVESAGFRVYVGSGTPEDCWHWRLSEGALLPDGNSEKDTRSYHAVQHEKTAWVAEAAEHMDAEILVWMDFGILHVPGITTHNVVDFLFRCERKASRKRIGMASIWGPPRFPVDISRIQWFCAGGVFTAPRHRAREWHELVVDEAVSLRLNGRVGFEVATWALAWAKRPDIVRAWLGNHDATLLEAGP